MNAGSVQPQGFLFKTVFLLLCWCVSSGAQGLDQTTSARDLFFVPDNSTPNYAPGNPRPGQNPATEPALRPNFHSLGIRHAWEWKDRGKWRQVTNHHHFRSGQQIRLAMMSRTDGYLYVFNHGSAGTKQVLFPDTRINDGDNRIFAKTEFYFPPGGAFTLSDLTGKERLYIFLSPQPIKDFASFNLEENELSPEQWKVVKQMGDHHSSTAERNLTWVSESKDRSRAISWVPGLVTYNFSVDDSSEEVDIAEPIVVPATTTVDVTGEVKKPDPDINNHDPNDPNVYHWQDAPILFISLELVHYS